jgi:ribosome-binding protein aMBF1 (putative translation factor)
MTRTSALLEKLDLSQPQLALWLRVAQPTVHRMATGQDESGPASKLLDQLEELLAAKGVAAARAWVLSGTVSPERIAAAAPAERPSHLMQSGFGRFS